MSSADKSQPAFEHTDRHSNTSQSGKGVRTDQHPCTCACGDKPSRTPHVNADDYEQRYPEDKYGEEFGPSSRVWNVYLDEAQKIDGELIGSWKDTTDILLVFAGLFSAVVATFVVQTATSLQLDYAQISASLLSEQIALMRAQANGIPLNMVPPSALNLDSQAPIANSDRWINGLWFTSLSVSLAVAFMAVLVKQWIQHYVTVVPGTVRDRARIHQVRLLGALNWNVCAIINGLPVLLHFAFLLFFLGLVMYLLPLDAAIAYTTLAIFVLAYGFYVVSNFLPFWYPLCPYKSPISSILASVLSAISPHPLPSSLGPSSGHTGSSKEESPAPERSALHAGSSRLYHLKKKEWEVAQARGDEVDAHALKWLYSKSSNPSVASIVMQAISGLRNDFPSIYILKQAINMERAEGIFGAFNLGDPKNGDKLTKAERFARAYHHLPSSSSAHPTFQKIQEEIVNYPTVLRRCIDNISLHSDRYPLQHNLTNGSDAHLDLELYKEASAELSLLTWSLLLRYSRLTAFDSPHQCWTHAFRVLDNFFSTFDRHRSLEYQEQWIIKFAMMFEYLCTLSICDDQGNSSPALIEEWGIASVLIAYGPSLSTTHMISWTSCILPDAMQVWCTLGLSLERGPRANAVSMHRILRGIRFFKYTLVQGSRDETALDNLREAARDLHDDLQKLLHSDVFWRQDLFSTEDRVLCFELLFEHEFWLVKECLSVDWSSQLVDLFLRSTRRKWCIANAGTNDRCVLSSFEEQCRLSRMDQEVCAAGFASYLNVLCEEDEVPIPNSRQELDRLFRPHNLVPAVLGLAILPNGDGADIVGKLWGRRRNNQAGWISVADYLARLASGRYYLWRWGHPSRVLTYIAAVLNMLGRKPQPPDPVKYLYYVSGADISEDNKQDGILYIENRPVYGPYTVTFHAKTGDIRNSLMTSIVHGLPRPIVPFRHFQTTARSQENTICRAVRSILPHRGQHTDADLELMSIHEY